MGHGRIRLRATDKGTAGLSHGEHCTVEKMTNRNALLKYKPLIVFASWMVINEDWTAEFRICPSVSEYILIGEVDDGCCGHPWSTWGVDPDMGCAEDCSSTSSVSSDSDSCKGVGEKSSVEICSEGSSSDVACSLKRRRASAESGPLFPPLRSSAPQSQTKLRSRSITLSLTIGMFLRVNLVRPITSPLQY